MDAGPVNIVTMDVLKVQKTHNQQHNCQTHLTE